MPKIDWSAVRATVADGFAEGVAFVKAHPTLAVGVACFVAGLVVARCVG